MLLVVLKENKQEVKEKMKKGLVFVLVLSLAGLGVGKGLVYGLNYYVDCYRGSDTNSGASWETAFKTINAATSKAVAGDTVYVNQGVYKETVSFANSGVAEARIILKAIGEVVLDGELARRCIELKERAYIDLHGIAVIRGNVFIGACTEIGFQNCVFCWNYRLIAGQDGAVTIDKASIITFQNCDFRYNSSWYRGGGAIYTYGSTYVIICDCNFYANSSYGGSAIRMDFGAPGSVIKNCNFVKNASTVGTIYLHGDGIKFCDYNNFYQNSGNDYGGAFPTGLFAQHDIHVNPEFINEDKGIFYLKPTSPLLKAGSVENGEFQNIGAYGVGYYSSYMADNWTGWIDENGNPVAVSNLVKLDEDGNIKLKEGLKSASVRSPVIDIQKDTGRIKSITFNATEFPELPSGFRQIVDYDETTYTAEIRWRGNNNLFAATDLLPEWQKVYKNTKIEPTDFTRYIQIELTLRLNAQ